MLPPGIEKSLALVVLVTFAIVQRSSSHRHLAEDGSLLGYRTCFMQDVHAGNLLVLNDGRVAFIDFGIVGRFSPGTWSGVSRLADGVAGEDFKVMAEVGALLSVFYEPFRHSFTELWCRGAALAEFAVI